MRWFLANDNPNSIEDKTRKVELVFSCNLFKYLKGLSLKGNAQDGYFYLYAGGRQWNTCRRETLTVYEPTGNLHKSDEPVNCEYYVFEGDIVNPVLWSDYIEWQSLHGISQLKGKFTLILSICQGFL